MSKTIDRTTEPTTITATRPALRLRYIALIFGAAGTLIAAWGSWTPSLWGDEVTSLMSAERPLPSLFVMLGHIDAVHGTYYFALHWWIALFGTSPFSIRFPSAIAVGFTVAAVVVIAWRLRSPRLAIIAGAVCCIVPRVTYMGEEARSFATSAAIVSWLTVVLIELIRREHAPRRLWIGYGVLLAVGTYFFLYVALFALAHLLVLLSIRASRTLFRRWAITVGLAAASVLPLIIFGFLERRQINYLAHDQVSPSTIFNSLWFGTLWFAVPAWTLIAVALIAAIRMRLLRAPAGQRLRALFAPTASPSVVLVAATWLVVPTLVLALAQTAIPSFTARYVSFCAPAAAILIACGIEAISRGRAWIEAVAVIALVAVSAPIYLAQRTPYSKNDSDWAVLSAVIGAHAKAGDAVVFDESINPYRRPRLAMHAYPAGFVNTRDVTLQLPFTSNTSWTDSVYTVAQAASIGRFDGIGRVWLIEWTGGTPDDYGVSDLQQLGFTQVGQPIHTHRESITEFTR